MTTKVYIIFEGAYSDRGIVKVFADEDKAKAYFYKMAPASDRLDMEIWDISDDAIIFDKKLIEEAGNTIKMGYVFHLFEDGIPVFNSNYTMLCKTDIDSRYIKGFFNRFGRFVKTVVAKDSSKEEYDRCLKVARDALAKAKTEREGL